MNLRNPVTSPDPTLPVLDACNQRYDRVLITDTQMRKHLSYMSRKYLRKLKPEERMDSNIQEERNREFLQNLCAHCDQPVNNFILVLVHKSEDQEILYYIPRSFTSSDISFWIFTSINSSDKQHHNSKFFKM